MKSQYNQEVLQAKVGKNQGCKIHIPQMAEMVARLGLE